MSPSPTESTPQSTAVVTHRFRLRLKTMLLSAIAKLDHVEPIEVSPALEEFEAQLDRVRFFIFDTLHPPAERKIEDERTEAESRRRVRSRGLEGFQTDMDQRLGRLCQMIAFNAPGPILAANVEMVLQTIVDLFDRIQPATFATESMRALSGHGDARVAALVRTIDEYRRGDR